MKRNKILHIINTDYRTNIMVPYNPMMFPNLAGERWKFIGKAMKVLPKEAQHYPILTLGIDDALGEIFGYFVGGAEVSNLINASLDGNTLEEKAQLLDSLITGESEDARQFFNGETVPIGHLVNTAGKYYDSIFEILERNCSYKLKRVEVKDRWQKRK